MRKESFYWMAIRVMNLIPLILISREFKVEQSIEFKDLNIVFLSSLGLLGFNTIFQLKKWSGFVLISSVMQLFVLLLPVHIGLRFFFIYTNISTLIFAYQLHKFSPVKFLVANFISICIRCLVIFCNESNFIFYLLPLFYYLYLSPSLNVFNLRFFLKNFLTVFFIDLLFFLISNIDKFSYLIFHSIHGPTTNYFFLSILSSVVVTIGSLFTMSRLKFGKESDNYAAYRKFVSFLILLLSLISFYNGRYYFDILSIIVSLFSVLVVYEVNVELLSVVSFSSVVKLFAVLFMSLLIFLIFSRPIIPFVVFIFYWTYVKDLTKCYMNILLRKFIN